MTATLLLLLATKATLVLLAGLGMTHVMTRASAAARHLVWVLTLAAAVAVPLVHVTGPAWTLAVLPQGSNSEASHPVVASDVTVVPVAPVESAPPESSALEGVTTDASLPAAVVAVDATTPVRRVEPAGASASTEELSWGAIVVRVWLAGVALMLLRLAIGIVWAAVTVRRAHDLPDTGWLDSLDAAAASLGLRRDVALRVSPRAAVPMATGLWRAVVLLPVSAIDWPEECRRVVLQHELAHVKRRDCLLQALAQGVCAIHWFNPAAHLAVARLRAEQERACDDLVLQVGTDARSYADHLFEIARSFRAATFPTWVTMSMGRPSQLEGRMLAILDSARARCAPSRPARAALAVATLLVALPFGALRLAAQAESTDAQDAAASAESLPFQAHESFDRIRNDAADVDVEVPSAGERFAASVDIVHGDADDVDVLALMPALHFGDAVRADVHVDERAIEAAGKAADNAADNAAKMAIRMATRTPQGTLAQGPVAVQAAPAVSDETRRRVADALISALNDENPQVRQEALSSLASMRDERAIPGLIRALGDTTPEVRMRALGALVQFNSAQATDAVMGALKDRSPEVRGIAARHLASLVSRGQLRDARYVDAFAALLRDDNADVRGQAAAALGRMRAPAAAAPLTQALRDASPDVREQAARALGQLGNADAVPALTPLLKDPATDVREQAARALGDLADPRAIDPLTAALKDSDAGVREEAARALGQIARGQRRGPRATPGVRVPTPPVIAFPPQAISIDPERIREMAERAQAAAERAQRDVERRMRDFDLRFDLFDVPVPPTPEPPPVAPSAPPAPPAPLR